MNSMPHQTPLTFDRSPPEDAKRAAVGVADERGAREEASPGKDSREDGCENGFSHQHEIGISHQRDQMDTGFSHERRRLLLDRQLSVQSLLTARTLRATSAGSPEPPSLGSSRGHTIIVMPAYNAERTLERIYADIPAGCYDEIIVVDDCSTDRTVEIARRLPLTLIRKTSNGGYGSNQKVCYDAALAHGADYVIMLHPDYQYDARVIPAAIDMLRLGICDVILGNRIRTRKEALAGGMPLAKYLANRGLTLIENVLSGQNLGEWHSGFRVYTRRVLETIPFHRNSDDFVFDSQFLVQCVHFGFKMGDIPVPVRYFDEASSINLRRSTEYALKTLGLFAAWLAHRLGIIRHPLLRPV